MKLFLLAIFTFLSASPTARASEWDSFSNTINLQSFLGSQYVGPIEWHVGDHMEYELSMGLLGKLGTITYDVTKEEGRGVWLSQHSVLSMKNDLQEMLVDRATGKVVKYLKNGQEATYDENPIQVEAQSNESVTVPAGTFTCIKTTGKTSSGAPVSMWTNAGATAIDGMVKTVLNSSMTIELIKFSRGH